MMCNCASHRGDVPKRADATPSAIIDAPSGYRVSIDACIAEAIRELWGHGIHTGCCCCGHNIEPPNVVLINPDDAKKAAQILKIDGRPWRIMGWRLCELEVLT